MSVAVGTDHPMAVGPRFSKRYIAAGAPSVGRTEGGCASCSALPARELGAFGVLAVLALGMVVYVRRSR